MAGTAYLTRLKASDSPSHRLLVLLDRHRVMSTTQIARATAGPARSVRYRMEQLEKHGLVGQTRPGLERGSSPRFWWLKPAGARIVTGTALAEGRPKPTTIPHGAAITEVFLVLMENGPAAGIEVLDWKTDRAGWQEWQTSSGYHGMNQRRLTPDAVCRLRVDTAGGPRELAVFVEVDLASMTQTQMRQKLDHYLAYRRDRAWDGWYESCPPMLLFTTTESRAVNFMRVAAKMLGGQASSSRWYSVPQAADLEAAGNLMVAACGLVYHPGDAVDGLCWTLPDPHASQASLAELLAARVAVQDRAAAAAGYVAAQEQQAKDAHVLERLGYGPAPGFKRGEPDARRIDDLDPRLREIFHALQRPGSGRELLDDHPEIAAAVLAWHRDPDNPELANQARELLTETHRRTWITDVQTLLAANDMIEAADPQLFGPIETLRQRHLLAGYERDRLREPARPEHTYTALQAESLAGYAGYRDQAVSYQWAQLKFLARRRTSQAELAAAFDGEHLFACGRCGIIKWADPEDPHAEYSRGICYACSADPMQAVAYTERGTIPTLAARLQELRHQLDQALTGHGWELPPPALR